MNDPLDGKIWFGKYKESGTSWRQVVEKDPEYARWLADEAGATPEDIREAIRDELDGADWGFRQ